MEFLLVVIMLLLVMMQNTICIVIGIKIGLALRKGERVELPNPVKAYKEHKANMEAQKEAEKELDKISTIMQNVENFDGTGFGQKEVPRW
jgi:biotin-(acetyl-CoA carboxylase) ligase